MRQHTYCNRGHKGRSDLPCVPLGTDFDTPSEARERFCGCSWCADILGEGSAVTRNFSFVGMRVVFGRGNWHRLRCVLHAQLWLSQRGHNQSSRAMVTVLAA